MQKKYLKLNMKDRKLFLDNDKIADNKKKLEAFLKEEPQMHSKDFATKVLLSNEVQSNNSVEGYYDDIEKIRQVVASSCKDKNKKETDKLRILNLYS